MAEALFRVSATEAIWIQEGVGEHLTSADALEVAIPSAVLGAVFVTLLVARHAVAPGLLQSIRMISPDKDQEYAVMLVAIVSVLGLTGVAAILVVVFLAWAVPLFS